MTAHPWPGRLQAVGTPREDGRLTVDWEWWARAWGTHMAGYMRSRDVPLAIMRELLVRCCPADAHVVELGAGTGGLSAALCDALPDITVTAIELDPLLERIGAEVLGDLGGRLRRADLDLRSTDWSDAVQGPVHAVISVAALHVLGADGTRAAYAAARRLLGGTGLLLNLDFATPDRSGPLGIALEAAAEAQLQVGASTSFSHHGPLIQADPVLADLWHRRQARFGPPPAEEPPYLEAEGHRRALQAAGFRQVVEPWRDLDLALLAATI